MGKQFSELFLPPLPDLQSSPGPSVTGETLKQGEGWVVADTFNSRTQEREARRRSELQSETKLIKIKKVWRDISARCYYKHEDGSSDPAPARQRQSGAGI